MNRVDEERAARDSVAVALNLPKDLAVQPFRRRFNRLAAAEETIPVTRLVPGMPMENEFLDKHPSWVIAFCTNRMPYEDYMIMMTEVQTHFRALKDKYPSEEEEFLRACAAFQQWAKEKLNE